MATILVPDDEAAVRRLVRTVLESAGYEVLDAADGEAGADAAIVNVAAGISVITRYLHAHPRWART